MVIVVQLVRMSDCGSEGRQFEPDQSPNSCPQAVETVCCHFFGKSNCRGDGTAC